MPYTRQSTFTAQDQIAALASAYRAQFIRTPVEELHPLARAMAEYPPMTLPDLAVGVLEQVHGVGSINAGADGFGAVQAALSTSEFPDIITETARGITAARRGEVLDDLLAVTAPIEVADYKPSSFVTVDVGELPAPSASTMASYFALKARMAGQPTQVYSLFGRLLMSRQAVVNDDRGFLPAALASFSNAAHRSEAARLAQLLEANPTLEDGVALFDASRSNVTVAALDAAGLATVGATLRNQPSESGQPTAARTHALICHPADEWPLYALLEAVPEPVRPRVVVNPHLADNAAWFAVGNPEFYPAIGRVRLRGSDETAISIGAPMTGPFRDQNGQDVDFNGLHFDVTHSVGYSVLSPVGICKFTKT